MTDDLVATFSLDHAPVRGRIVRLGALALDPILRRHNYPRPVALLLGETITLAALVASLLKAEGRLIVQAQGEGLVPLLVAEHGPGGALRGYARLADGAEETLARLHRLSPRDLLGSGTLVMTLDRGDDQGEDGEDEAGCRGDKRVRVRALAAPGRVDKDRSWRMHLVYAEQAVERRAER